MRNRYIEFFLCYVTHQPRRVERVKHAGTVNPLKDGGVYKLSPALKRKALRVRARTHAHTVYLFCIILVMNYHALSKPCEGKAIIRSNDV